MRRKQVALSDFSLETIGKTNITTVEGGGEATAQRSGLSFDSLGESCFEVCSESLEAARAAEAGGADRVELCADLSVGGITPAIDLMRDAIQILSIPVHVMIRPHGGSFAYSTDAFEQMRRQTVAAKRAGAAGIVFGILRPDGRIDVERSRALVELAYPMKATFHRGFDAAPELSEALEAVIETGADCLLTSGGEPDVLAGADAIARLNKQAGNRLRVMAVGGLRLANVFEVIGRTGVSYLHGSLTEWRQNAAGTRTWTTADGEALEANVREALRLFRQALSVREVPSEAVAD